MFYRYLILQSLITLYEIQVLGPVNRVKRNKRLIAEQQKKWQKAYLAENENDKTMGYLYILQSQEFYKIGVSKNHPRQRVKQLQTGNPYPIKLVTFYRRKDYQEVEQRLHKELSRYRQAGEWFNCSLEEITRRVEGENFQMFALRTLARLWSVLQVIIVFTLIFAGLWLYLNY